MSKNILEFNQKKPHLGQDVYIDSSALLLGDAYINSDSSVWPMAVIRADMNKIRIGKKTNIQDGCILHITHKSKYNLEGCSLYVGDEVTVGHGVTLHGCRIGNRCLIGIGSIILDGAVVEDNVMIAAGSLVPPNKLLQSGYLYKGNPIKKSRELTEQEVSFFEYSAINYVNLKNQYLQNR